ncbi:MAG TPA: hypothetical protein VFA18_02330 [Gemmataceae bacterium]|nr:hypothetical protein [Gemmataceae bacterium]
MTILGKILVFVNLVLSLVTAWFIAMTFTKDVNWKAAADQWQDRYKVIEADARAFQEDHLQRLKDKDGQLAKLQQQISALQGEKDNLAKQKTELDAAIAKLQTQHQQDKANTDAQLAEMTRLKEERNQLQGAVDQKSNEILALHKQKQEVQDNAVAQQIAYLNEKQLNEKLREENEKITQENERITSSGGPGSAKGSSETTTVAKPPPEDIEGFVTEVDTHDGLVTLSIGSDNGLARNQTLEVFRLRPRPEYVGRILILGVQPHQAVARAIAPLRAGPIRKGDQVASRITARK